MEDQKFNGFNSWHPLEDFESWHFMEEFQDGVHFKVWYDDKGVHAHVGKVGVILPMEILEYRDAINIITSNEHVSL
jgi:hypothetical protein